MTATGHTASLASAHMSAPAVLTRSAVDDAVRYAERWLAVQQHRLRVPGVQAAVWYDGDVVSSSAHGVADLPSGTPLTTEHLFRIASHSKTFTAVAVMQLAEAGRLRLDDAAQTWLPFLAGEPIGAVTLHQLLSHTAGVTRDGEDSDHWQLTKPFPDADELRRMALADGAAVLGTDERFKYSNVTYALLGAIIEAASGEPYASYVEQHVVQPLGLANTGPELDATRAGEYATGHTALAYADHRVPIEHVDTRALAAATGFYGTAEDIVRYAAAHLPGDQRLLTDASKRQMQRPVAQVDDEGPEAYGLGIAVTEVAGRRLLGHGGGYPGHITKTLFETQSRLAVSVFTNAIDGLAATLARGIVLIVDLAARAQAQLRDAQALATEPAPDRSVADTFTGRFATLWGTVDVVVLGGRLMALDPTSADPVDGAVWLRVLDEQTLVVERCGGYGAPGERLRYDRDADGSVTSVRAAGGSTWWSADRFAAAIASRAAIDLASGGATV